MSKWLASRKGSGLNIVCVGGPLVIFNWLRLIHDSMNMLLQMAQDYTIKILFVLYTHSQEGQPIAEHTHTCPLHVSTEHRVKIT